MYKHMTVWKILMAVAAAFNAALSGFVIWGIGFHFLNLLMVPFGIFAALCFMLLRPRSDPGPVGIITYVLAVEVLGLISL